MTTPTQDVLDGITADIELLRMAVEADDPKAELMIRLDDVRSAISSLSATLTKSSPVEAVAVKGLEWREEPIPPAWECLASTGVGLYCIPLGRDVFELRFRDQCTLGEFDTLEAAKAAAQADFESRIRAALVATPPAPVVRYQLTAMMRGRRTRLVISGGDDAYTTTDRKDAERVLVEVQKLSKAYTDAHIEVNPTLEAPTATPPAPTSAVDVEVAKALADIETISDRCVNEEYYTSKMALNDIANIRSVIKRAALAGNPSLPSGGEKSS
ncbi:hypothetical protein NKI25_18545 [Mesorhizobium sp. M0808]|uniref:hypothetical protein n=1 Tax=Mesorhizobium sp. M0808 TaxID=2957002 RepID=UPI003338AB9A